MVSSVLQASATAGVAGTTVSMTGPTDRRSPTWIVGFARFIIIPLVRSRHPAHSAQGVLGRGKGPPRFGSATPCRSAATGIVQDPTGAGPPGNQCNRAQPQPQPHHVVAPRAPRSLSDQLDLDVRPPSYGANLLEFGVRFADGREISNREPLPVRPRDDGLFMSLRGGDGDETVWWIHPLGPPGPLTFWVTWERAGIPPTPTQIDARILREAADRAERLWP